jgi:hypothetical protein
MYWQKLSANLAQISATGGKRVHRTQYTYTVQTFSWLLLSFAAESSASDPQSGKAPYHSLPLPHLFYLYISGPFSQDIQDSCAYIFCLRLPKGKLKFRVFHSHSGHIWPLKENKGLRVWSEKGKLICRIPVWRHTTSGSPSSSSFAWGWSRCPGIYGHDPQDADPPPPPTLPPTSLGSAKAGRDHLNPHPPHWNRRVI